MLVGVTGDGPVPERGSGPDSLSGHGFGVMLTETALVVVHASVLSPPEFTVAGVAVKLPIVGGTGCATFTVTGWFVLPPGPVAVKTYVVVCCGVTPGMLPVSGNTDELTEGAIVTAVAFEVCHESVIASPAVMLVELAEKATLGFGGVTVIVTDWDAVPPGPLAVST